MSIQIGVSSEVTVTGKEELSPKPVLLVVTLCTVHGREAEFQGNHQNVSYVESGGLWNPPCWAPLSPQASSGETATMAVTFTGPLAFGLGSGVPELLGLVIELDGLAARRAIAATRDTTATATRR